MQLFNDSTTTAELHALVTELSTSHLGILSNTGIRAALRRTAVPCDIVGVDWRKLHEWNLPEMLGYDLSSDYMMRFVAHRHGLDGRQRDTRGQWGGDEFIIACGVGQGIGLIMRLVALLDTLTAELPTGVRQRMAVHTGGLVDSFNAVFVLCQKSHNPLIDATRAINELGTLKGGNATGNRATSGKPGTIIGSIKPFREG